MTIIDSVLGVDVISYILRLMVEGEGVVVGVHPLMTGCPTSTRYGLIIIS
jgi:hypothetical protein